MIASYGHQGTACRGSAGRRNLVIVGMAGRDGLEQAIVAAEPVCSSDW